MVRPSRTAGAATKVDESPTAAIARNSQAVAVLDAAWAPWGVQVAGDFSLDRAMATFAQIQQQFPLLMGERPLVVRKVDRSRGWAPLYQILFRPPTRRLRAIFAAD
jgi:hypothetical protein